MLRNGTVCERQDCPKPDCPDENASVKTLPGQCCPVCSQKCSLVITDCPKEPVKINLPKTQDYVVHEYLPSVMDCLKLSREITQTKKPVGDIYKWQDGNGPVDVTITVSAKSTQPGHSKDEVKCKFTVIVTGNNDNNTHICTRQCSIQLNNKLTRTSVYK